jgi:hypothetical protein
MVMAALSTLEPENPLPHRWPCLSSRTVHRGVFAVDWVKEEAIDTAA